MPKAWSRIMIIRTQTTDLSSCHQHSDSWPTDSTTLPFPSVAHECHSLPLDHHQFQWCDPLFWWWIIDEQLQWWSSLSEPRTQIHATCSISMQVQSHLGYHAVYIANAIDSIFLLLLKRIWLFSHCWHFIPSHEYRIWKFCNKVSITTMWCSW